MKKNLSIWSAVGLGMALMFLVVGAGAANPRLAHNPSGMGQQPSRALRTPQPPEIVGGVEATPGEWPWQVALVLAGYSDLYQGQQCGGTLVATRWVVTAAHCMFETGSDMYVDYDAVAGVHNLENPDPGYQQIHVDKIVIHPNYDPNSDDYDIALLRLASPVTLGGSGATAVALAPLVPANVGDLAGVMAVVTGWGDTSGSGSYSPVLMKVGVPIITNAACDSVPDYNGGISDNMLCAGGEAAGGKDSCQGDSGGPLVAPINGAWQLAGIVSWGSGCGDPGVPGVYTRVSRFTNWILSQIGSPVQPSPTPTQGVFTPTPTATLRPLPTDYLRSMIPMVNYPAAYKYRVRP